MQDRFKCTENQLCTVVQVDETQEQQRNVLRGTYPNLVIEYAVENHSVD